VENKAMVNIKNKSLSPGNSVSHKGAGFKSAQKTVDFLARFKEAQMNIPEGGFGNSGM
jgi:hypothetical protein